MHLGVLMMGVLAQVFVHGYLSFLSEVHNRSQSWILDQSLTSSLERESIYAFDQQWSSPPPRLDYGAHSRKKDGLVLCLVEDLIGEGVVLRCD